VWWRIVRAQVDAHRGEHAEALRHAREAVAWVERTDATTHIAQVYSSLARVLQAVGRRDEALAAMEHALELYEQKGHQPLVEQTRAALVELRAQGGLR
jgi:ATP/maltotriose-dependent transcriptional regulator MalT